MLPVAFDANGYTGLYSTAGDLVRFGMYHLKQYPQADSVLSDSSIDMLWKYEDTSVHSSRRMGWNVQHDFGCFAIQHSGGGPGMHNWLYLLPTEGIVVATMSNAWYPTTPETDQVLVDLVSGAHARAAVWCMKRTIYEMDFIRCALCRRTDDLYRICT